MKKQANRLLSALLVLLMLFTLLPVASAAPSMSIVDASEEIDTWLKEQNQPEEEYDLDVEARTAATDSTPFYRILHLDCGRKYFTPEWVKALINEMADAGYTHLQLAFGNDGLRFLLDDMSVTANGTTYSSADVKRYIQAGNKAYYDAGTVNEWTEDEMTDIIAHAKTMGIEIIPLLNTPGHMDAILNAAEGLVDYGAAYYGSVRTIDVTNESVVAFTQALVGKYINYFAGKGCKLFNIGADEYANDVYTGGSMGFGNLQNQWNYHYDDFVNYINGLVELVENAKMTAIAFNDGVYYANDKTTTIDSRLLVSYWSSGWKGGYSPRSAANLAIDGFGMINTHGDFYYVLGKSDAFDSGYSKAAEFSNTSFAGSTVSNPVGSTFCIWCDYPNAETEQVVAQKTRLVLRAMAARMQDKSIDSINTGVISGGFNADGSINKNEPVVPVTPVAFPENAGVAPSIKVGETANYTLDAPAEWTSSNENVLSLTVADTTNAAVTASSVQATAHAAGTTTVTAALTDGTAIYETKVTVTSDSTDPTEPDLSGLKDEYKGTVTPETGTGATYYELINGASAIVSGEKYLIANGSSGNVRVLASDKAAYSTTVTNSRISSSSVNQTHEWVLTADGTSGYTIQNVSSGKYLYPNAKRSVGYWDYSLVYTASSGQTVTIADASQREYAVIMSREVSDIDIIGRTHTTTSYIKSGTSSYTADRTRDNLYLYHKVVEPAGTVWKVSTEGLKKLIVDNNLRNLDESLYTTDSWSKFSAALDDANSYIDQYGNNSNAAFFTDKGPAVAAQAKINESALNLFNAWQALAKDPYSGTTLPVELWITNSPVNGSVQGTTSNNTVNVKASDVLDTNGTDLATLVPESGISGSEANVVFWKGTVLTSGNRQTSDSGVDQTFKGSDFTMLRYDEDKSAWQYLNSGAWTNIAATDQVVAYYLQKTEVTQEITTLTKDWGFDTSGTTPDWSKGKGQVALSFAVVYPDGSISPTEDNIYSDATTIFNYWDGRNIGIVACQENSDYEISKITVTPGKRADEDRTGNVWYTDDDIIWEKKKLDDGVTEWYNETEYWNDTMDSDPSVNGENIVWSAKNTAYLVLIYLKPIVKETNLHVIYHDDTENIEILSYDVVVNETETFLNSLKNNGSDVHVGEFTLGDGAYVTNTSGNNQTFNKNLVQLTDIDAKYRSGYHKYDRAEISEDGKTLTLHYVLDTEKVKKVTVIDFGQPVTVEVSSYLDASETREIASLTANGGSSTSSKYGTLTINGTESLTYTPNTVLTQPDMFTINFEFRDGSTEKLYPIFVPASNVLYEETFFNETTGKYIAWEHIDGTTDVQSADQTTRYGYDDIYATGTGNSMDSSYTATLGEGGSTNDLTTTFTGTAFDLIGTCGSDTGYVYLKIVDAAGHGRAAVIDTSYSGNYGTLHQVPLAHLVMGNANKDYTVTVFGAYRKVANATGNTASVMRARSYAADGLDAIYDRLAEDGFAPDEVEYIYFDASSELAQMDNATFAALDMADAMTDGTVAPMASNTPGSKVEIDGFRVYRTTDSTYYSVSERGMTYARMLDMVDDNFTAYVENDGTGTWSLSNYEANGGPQNEIYLDKNGSVVLNTENMTSLQITARVASETGSVRLLVNNQLIQSIATATEMYYDINVENIDTLTISTDSNDVLLGLANIKYKGEITPVTQANIDEAIALLNSAPVEPEPVEPEPTVFTPERFDADIHVTRAIFRKYVTVSVKTSLDVAYITVNGQRVDPINNRWFSWGANGTRSFTYRDTIGRNDSVAYEVIAYDADGNASEPIILH